MKYEGRLDSANLTHQANLNFRAVMLIVMNNTPYSVIISRGVANLPTSDFYDYIVPAGMYSMFPVVGGEFALKLDIMDGTSTNIDYHASMFTFIDEDEVIPNFALSSFKEVFTVNTVGSFIQKIDTRGAHALSIEFTYPSVNPGGYLNHLTNGTLLVYSAPTPSTPITDWQVIRYINTPFSMQTVRAVIPITSDCTILWWTALAGGTSKLSYSLWDAMPDFTPTYTTNYRNFGASPASAPVGSNTTLVDRYLRGEISQIAIQLRVAAGADFRIKWAIQTTSPTGTNPTDIWVADLYSLLSTIPSGTIENTGRNSDFLSWIRLNQGGEDIYQWIFPCSLFFTEKMLVKCWPILGYNSSYLSVRLNQEVG